MQLIAEFLLPLAGEGQDEGYKSSTLFPPIKGEDEKGTKHYGPFSALLIISLTASSCASTS